MDLTVFYFHGIKINQIKVMISIQFRYILKNHRIHDKIKVNIQLILKSV